VLIGTKKHNITIIPDYTLWHADKALLVLDAKGPKEAIVGSHHVEQAYSYAIHPDVRVGTYALCNGRRLVVYDIDKSEPVLDVAAHEFDSCWEEIENYLSPASLETPAIRNFLPDLGLALEKLGDRDAPITFVGLRPQAIVRLSAEHCTMSAYHKFPDAEGRVHIASFDFPTEMIDPLLSCLAEPLAEQVRGALAVSPFTAYLDYMLDVSLGAVLGTVIKDDYGKEYIPFVVIALADCKFERTPFKDEARVPAYFFRLRAAFEALQRQ
jgi:hypothetical protein